MNVLHLIRRESAISLMLALTLAFSLIILPLASWGFYDASMQTNVKVEESTYVDINNCHFPSNEIDLQGCEKNCCNDDDPYNRLQQKQ